MAFRTVDSLPTPKAPGRPSASEFFLRASASLSWVTGWVAALTMNEFPQVELVASDVVATVVFTNDSD